MNLLAVGLAVLGAWNGQSPTVKIDYQNFNGLTLDLGEVPLITGSSFQYYEKGWTKGYYSSAWKPVEKEILGDGSIQIRFNGADGQVAGNQVYKQTPDGFEATYQFRWRGDKPVMLEACFGRVWAPLLAKGSLTLDGYQAGPLDRPAKSGSTFEQRLLGQPATSLVFSAPFGKASVESTKPIVVMDGRNYDIDWAQGKELLWVGVSGQEIKPQDTVTYQLKWTISPGTGLAIEPKSTQADPVRIANAVTPPRTKLPLLPMPKSVDYSGGYETLSLPLKWEATEELDSAGSELNELLSTRWDTALVDKHPSQGSVVTARIGNLGLKGEGYRLTVTDGKIEIVGQDVDGVKNGVRTLVGLVEARGGELVVPRVTVTDWPSVAWRGVHMFVGPQALDFQTQLMKRVLAPMKFNKVVLQCERTAWDSTPGTSTPITMPKKDLVALFDRYRAHGIEPIPLVQSMGHCEWLFANKRFLEFAVNPDVPYTLDPRKAGARDLLTKLWTEIVTDLKPKTVHFGLDEINMRGMPDDDGLATRLWEKEVPFLDDLAKKLNVQPMIWGDMMLATSEAPDAANAPSPEVASARRRVVGKGTLIGDWHYKNDPRASIFTSLGLWKKAGMKPIASTWYRPDNIYGFTQAAIDTGSGTMQTTWAGYESNEANMVRSFNQFSAYILAADYAWSGRKELPAKLPYDPDAVLQRMYFWGPQVVRSVAGHSLVWEQGSKNQQIGEFTVAVQTPVQMMGVIDPKAIYTPQDWTLHAGVEGKRLVLAMNTLARVDDNKTVASVKVVFANGGSKSFEVSYGSQVRAETDSRPSYVSPRANGLSAVAFDLGDKPVKIARVEVHEETRAAGLRIYGGTVY